MKVLVINSGSSSLKYQLFDMDDGSVIAKGLCERIGIDGKVTHKVPGRPDYKADVSLPGHDEALKTVFGLLTDAKLGVLKDIHEVDAIGHRVAHGGEKFTASSPVTPEMVSYLESIVPINPLHGPAAIKGMKACLAMVPDTPQVAVFDTSYYSTVPKSRYIYGVPYEYYEKDGVRRYGFHGTSHRYVSQKVADLAGKKKEELKIITCHLGNGSSISATDGGKAVDTSMGFTPQEGILMGTRSGSVDPTVVTYIMKKHGYTPDQMDEVLNKKSGFLGLSGSSDSRNVEDAYFAHDPKAELTIDVLVDGIKRYIGAYTAEMNGLDILVFTAGIGENSPLTRDLVCRNMSYLGIELDKEKNEHLKRGEAGLISSQDSKVQVWVVPTNEEYMIALDTLRLAK